ncbi:MAG: UbiA family prenyltransferase, partial [Pseudomonadota bacterium]
WTPPHFWALAIHRREEYAKVDEPMLPVTHGIEFTKHSIFLYTWVLVAVSFLPYLTGMSGLLYLIGALVLDAGFVYCAWCLKYTERPLAAIHTFRYSIFYLMMLFVVLLADHFILNF